MPNEAKRGRERGERKVRGQGEREREREGERVEWGIVRSGGEI